MGWRQPSESISAVAPTTRYTAFSWVGGLGGRPPSCQPLFFGAPKMTTRYLELIYESLHRACWSLGVISYINLKGELIWIADAHRGNEHITAEGKSITEAFWRLYCLTELSSN